MPVSAAWQITPVGFIANHLSRLTPFEVIRVEQGVNQNDDVHEW